MIESVCSVIEEAAQIPPNQGLLYQELLYQENACLRAIIVDLLIKNQKLRWAEQQNPQPNTLRKISPALLYESQNRSNLKP